MKITYKIKLLVVSVIIANNLSGSLYAYILASPDKLSAREKKKIITDNNTSLLSSANLPRNIVFFGNNNPKEDKAKIYGLAYNLALNTNINDFTNNANNTPYNVGKQIANMIDYWPMQTVFLALFYAQNKSDVFPKLVFTESQHIIVAYNDGTLDAINEKSPIIAMFDITDDNPCLPKITKTDNYWIGVCKAISVANKLINIESVGPRHDERIVKTKTTQYNKK